MARKLKVFLLRRFYRLQNRFAWRKAARPPVNVSDRTIAGRAGEIPLRIYVPDTAEPERIIVYFHGGGWVLGDLDTHQPFCMQLCHHSRSIVIAADYRLAPEHPFPAAVEDCLAATRWVLENRASLGGLERPVFVAGDSAGGNLAAVAARETEGLAGQVLIYPATAHCSSGLPSYEENAKGPVLTRNLMVWFWDTYLQGSRAEGRTSDPLATPLDWESPFEIPPAIVITAGLDPLRDEGARFAEKIDGAGIPCRYRLYPKAVHGFVCSQGPSANHAAAMHDIEDWLRSF